MKSNLIPMFAGFYRVGALLVAFLAAAVGMMRADTPIFYYYHSDHLGSTSVVTNAQGAQIDHYQYTAYGRTRSTAPAGLPLTNRFTSQAYDDGSGLYYYNARYYDPETGNFIQPDTIVPDAGDPQSMDRYCYVRNNPLNRTDPSGHNWEDAKQGLSEFGGQTLAGYIVTQIAPPYSERVDRAIPINSGFASPAGRALDTAIGMTQGTLEMLGGATLIGGSGVAEVASVGIATPVAVPTALERV